MNINIIVAMCKKRGIGYNNSLPWKVSSDLKKFRIMTTGKGNNAIIMGKNTYESIKGRSLPNRDNLILSTSLSIDKTHQRLTKPPGLALETAEKDDLKTDYISKSFNNISLLEDFVKNKNYDEIWIIGGEKIYNYFLNEYPSDNILSVNKIFSTYIDDEIDCDTFFPEINYEEFRFTSQAIHQYLKEPCDFNILDRVYERGDRPARD